MTLINLIWVYGGLALATLVCAAACWWGGRAERVCAATLWVAWVLTLLVQSHGAKGPGDQVILIDTACLVIFTALSLKERRMWILLIAASQLDDVTSHFAARMFHYGLWSYIVVTGIWGGHFILGCLVVATIGYRLRLRREAAAPARLTASAG